MDKKTLIIIIIAVILIAAGVSYYYWNKKTSIEPGSLVDDITRGVFPSLNTNPLEGKPDINPADKANPYGNIKTNPF